MESESTREDVEARLRDTAEEMSDRLASLQDELSSSGTSLRDWVVENPWKSVGAMLAAGVTVGALFGGRRDRGRPEHAELLDQYVKALRAQMEEAVAAGESPSEALEQTLRGRVPVVVLEQEEDTESGVFASLVGSGAAFLLKTLIREFGQEFMTSALGDRNVKTDGPEAPGE